MNVLLLLLFCPLVIALLCLVAPGGAARGLVVTVGSLAVAAASIVAGWRFLGGEASYFEAHSHLANELLFYGGLAVGAFLLWCCRLLKDLPKSFYYIPVLIVVQMAVVAWCEKSGQMPEVHDGLYIDSLSAIMALIIGIVGTLIAVYAVSYMRDYHAHHPEIRDNQRWFFFTIFLFLSGMFGVVFCNNLSWLFFAWEITTLCSFLLIGYSKTEEATRNAFHALGLNLIGGLGFAVAILLLTTSEGEMHTLALKELVGLGSAVALMPALLISFAGLAKSAQMPFSSWLLGAMVAPTPVSALLHSSTMVKAGVFIIIKFAPLLHDTAAGFFVALIGAVTFLMTSLIAVTQSNAKRVLAYSTIANLGLIVMCAGIGTNETVWAAILLTIFHAVAKALLFLGVGTVEHQIGSRDIEDMEGLIVRFPSLAVMMLIGILGMFLAPFGMLISKYATIRALLDSHGIPGGGVFLAMVLAFGSAPTLFFWAKWMGKLVSVPRGETQSQGGVPAIERLVLGCLAAFTFFSCVFFAPLASHAIDPYVISIYGVSMALEMDTLVAMDVMIGVLFLLPMIYFVMPLETRLAPGYLAGANVEGSQSYRGAMGATRTVETRNYYLKHFIDEGRLTWVACGLAGVLVLIMFMAPLT